MYNDYELVYLAQERDEMAYEILCDKYKKLIYGKANRAFLILKKMGLEFSDAVLEARIGFDNAINGYNQDDTTVFSTFANLCIDRQMSNLIFRCNSDKYKILNNAVTLDFDDEVNLYNVLTDNSCPESEVINRFDVSFLYERVREVLTPFEDFVFILKLEGFKYSEITEILDIGNKEAYNAISRIKNKINKLLHK